MSHVWNIILKQWSSLELLVHGEYTVKENLNCLCNILQEGNQRKACECMMYLFPLPCFTRDRSIEGLNWWLIRALPEYTKRTKMFWAKESKHLNLHVLSKHGFFIERKILKRPLISSYENTQLMPFSHRVPDEKQKKEEGRKKKKTKCRVI